MNARVEAEEKVSKAGNPYTKYNIYYDGIGHGVGATTKKQGWAKVYTYGGKLVENIVQAIARDILAHAMMLAHKLGMFIVGHVHDEIICEEEIGWGSFGLSDLNQCLTAAISWARGLPLGADGYEGPIYKKG